MENEEGGTDYTPLSGAPALTPTSLPPYSSQCPHTSPPLPQTSVGLATRTGRKPRARGGVRGVENNPDPETRNPRGRAHAYRR